MKVVMTGASGFLGSHLTRGLIASGHTVAAAVRASTDLGRLEGLSAGIRPVDLDREGIDGLFPASDIPDAVVHAATFYGRGGGDADRVFESNVRFPTELATTAAARGVPVFINTDTFYPADHPHLPDYARSKKQFANQGEALFSGRGRVFINFRLQHLYGPGDGEEKFIPFLIRSCLENIPEIPLTDGTQKRDFIYVSDVVRACLCLLDRAGDLPKGCRHFDVGTGVSTTVRTLAEKVREATGSRSRLHFGALPRSEGDLMESRADTRELVALGWRPLVGLDEGIALTVKYYSAAGGRAKV